MRSIATRFWLYVDRRGPDECWEWRGGLNPKGYGIIRGGASRLAHRTAWQLTHGKVADLVLCHSCDNRRCVNPAHLFEGTQSDNVSDMDSKGRRGRGAARGSSHPQSRLTEIQARDIRANYALCRVRMVDLAERYGVSLQTVSNVVRGRRYAHAQH